MTGFIFTNLCLFNLYITTDIFMYKLLFYSSEATITCTTNPFDIFVSENFNLS